MLVYSSDATANNEKNIDFLAKVEDCLEINHGIYEQPYSYL